MLVGGNSHVNGTYVRAYTFTPCIPGLLDQQQVKRKNERRVSTEQREGNGTEETKRVTERWQITQAVCSQVFA